VEKKTQVDAVTAEYNAVNDKHTVTQMVLASTKDLQTLLTSLAGTFAQSTGSGGYMDKITDAYVWLAQAAAEEEQVYVWLEMSRCKLCYSSTAWPSMLWVACLDHQHQ
jgi:hypothetical protein